MSQHLGYAIEPVYNSTKIKIKLNVKISNENEKQTGMPIVTNTI